MNPQQKSAEAARLSNVILGGQDGLVNVLGLILGLAAATDQNKIVLAGGFAATFAESISMAAVAYTSRSGLVGSNRAVVFKQSLVIGLSTIVGSVIPLLPFVLLPTSQAIVVALIVSGLALGLVGAYKSRLTNGRAGRGAIALIVIGLGAAIAGYAVGLLFR